ncbi:MAG TPA: T9SS type A sorting domain-containing protein [Saprospiraceae bacterium]|nr:T9SS type A sorting domain-containing protein [Saprospiraceae bacterium]
MLSLVGFFYGTIKRNDLFRLHNQIESLMNDKNALFLQWNSNIVAALNNLLIENNSIPAIEVYEQNQKLVNTIMLQKMISNDWSFTPSEKVQINVIANQCPFTGGEGVYRARALAANYELNRYNDEMICITTMAGPRSNIDKENKVSFYPNPTSDFVNIMTENREQKIMTISLLNLDGKILYAKTLEALSDEYVLDVSEINTGIYMIQVELSDGISVNKKLIKN